MAPFITNGISNISDLVGSSNANNQLTGPNATWDISGPNSGTVDGLTFSAFPNIKGGPATNDFAFLPGGSISGNIDGGGGNDTLDYSQYGARPRSICRTGRQQRSSQEEASST